MSLGTKVASASSPLAVTMKAVPALASDGEGSLFDVVMTIPEKMRTIRSGEDLLISMEMINFGESGHTDTELTYIITKEDGGDVVYLEHEERIVETQDQFLKYLELGNLQHGNYKVYAMLVYDNSTATASSEFEVTLY